MLAPADYSGNLLSNNKSETLYGNKVSDILSYLPADLKNKYNELGKARRDVTGSNSAGNEDHPAFANENGYDNYRRFQSEQQTQELKNSLKKLDGNSKADLYSITKAQLLKQNSSPLFTMDDNTKASFTKAASSNPMYLMQLEKAIDELYKVYGNRLNFGVQRNPMTNKISQVPFYKSGGFSATAKFETTSVETRLTGAATVLYQLVAIGAIEPAAELKVRPISLTDGKFKITKEEVEYNQIARKLKLPLKGTFLVNDRTTNVGKRYATFSGTDVTVSYALGYYVGNIEGLRSITWSISRGKSNVPLTEEVNAVSRARGRRTIAGTMIFAMFDEHPITAIYPESYFPQDDEFSADSPIRQQFLKPDQLPAFDLSLIFTNEYGYNSILTLFGVEIMDDSGVINIDDLVNENVIHYTAKDIDLLHSVKTDKNGIIDLYEMQSLQSDSLWKRRSQIVYGEEGNSFYEQHAAYYDKIYSSSGYPTIVR